MQDTKKESGVNAEYQRDGGIHGGNNHGKDVNAFDDNHHFDDRSRRNNTRRNHRGGYRGRDAHNSNNWREDRMNEGDYEQRPYHREAGEEGSRGGGRGHYSGSRQGEGQKYRAPFSQNRGGEQPEEGERERERERGEYPSRRGGRGRGRGRGRGGFQGDAPLPANDADALPQGRGADEPPTNRPPPRREDRGEFRGRGERRGGAGSIPAGASNFHQDPREAGKAAEASRDNKREERGALEVLPPGFKRRTQRAEHLRRNCHDENEILELFEHHHRQKGISLENYDNIPVSIMPRDIIAVEDFSELNVEPALMANIERCGYQKPTPVQRYGIPVAIAGNDLMACAQTGSGKTAAFLIPIVQHILVKGVSPAYRGVCYPIGLIMAPTRELALQIYDEVRKLTFRTDIFYDVVYGGTPYPTRFENDILVACPGRLKDIFERDLLSFKAIKFLVLDEADRMLEMGFEEQIEYLVASRYTDMPMVDERQTLMFSATFPTRILNLARRFLRKYYYLLTIGRVGSTTKNITQVIERVQETEKLNRLFELIYEHKKSDLVLIFVETKKAADYLHHELKVENIPSSTIHGDRRQQDRERALAEFKSGVTPILVATDVASRGLDIPNVSHVIQYDLPSEMDDYVHRIGRTGRAGNKGVATCFYNRNNRKICLEMYKYLREHEQNIPSWFKEEAELVEGDAMLSREFGGNRRRGDGGGNNYNDPSHARDPEEKWGGSAAASGRGNRRGKTGSRAGNSAAGGRSHLTTDIDDGGF